MKYSTEHIENMGGQDPTLKCNMPMAAIEQSEQELKKKGTYYEGPSQQTKSTNTRRNT